MEDLIIARRLRVPVDDAGDDTPGWGGVAARQLDAALLSVGFTCSPALLGRLTRLPGEQVIDLGVRVLAAVRRLVGDHVEHNAYFVDFPKNVPDTLEFWAGLLREAVLDPVAATRLQPGTLNLLDLPRYGGYQHTYADLLAAHAELIPLAKDRVTVLELGGSLRDEARELYLSLAGSEIPLAAEDLAALRALAAFCADLGADFGADSCADGQPEHVPVRENRAVVNEVRLAARQPLLVDTVTDVLRLAALCSDGDVTLSTPTRLRSFRRAERRILLAALDAVPAAKHGDVLRHREQWKRLGERLHPHEYPQFPRAAQVFDVARGVREAASFGGRVEAALAAGRTDEAVSLLEHTPGALLRRLDHLLRAGDGSAVLEAAERSVARASGRVLLSLREHLQNRFAPVNRVFTNRSGRAWTTPDTRAPLDEETLSRTLAILDEEIGRRLPDLGELIVDPAVLDVALPLSGKAVAPGLGMLPRGSEFIDVRLSHATKPIIIPQVHIYAGEPFEEAAEAFFGYMTRDAAQEGRPFEPRTVRMKSDLRGSGRVALPLVFLRGDDGAWRVKWLHLYLSGYPAFNQVEGNRVTASLLVRSIVERDYLRVGYLVGLLRAKSSASSTGGHLTYIGLEAPADLPEGARVYTPATLHELIPA
ncbi:hypothetical protein [Microbispora bryophytorum]|uniref:hypothetical protein n=1 Tax=Microbispora bryophytorum TaxID=1460882 RepID=UPI0033ECBC26